MEAKLNINKTIVMSKNKKIFAKSKTAIMMLVMIMSSVLLSKNGSAQEGKDLFKTNCAACHTTSDKISVGPGLKGVNENRDEE